MSNYIDREAFIAEKRQEYCADCGRRKGFKYNKLEIIYDIGGKPCRSCFVHDLLNDMEDYHAADVRENVRGEWIHFGDEKSAKAKCAQCGFKVCVTSERSDSFVAVKSIVSQYIFCPNCGADCRGDSDE